MCALNKILSEEEYCTEIKGERLTEPIQLNLQLHISNTCSAYFVYMASLFSFVLVVLFKYRTKKQCCTYTWDGTNEKQLHFGTIRERGNVLTIQSVELLFYFNFLLMRSGPFYDTSYTWEERGG